MNYFFYLKTGRKGSDNFQKKQKLAKKAKNGRKAKIAIMAKIAELDKIAIFFDHFFTS